MDAKLKPLDEQVIVITGASSGIGLATAEAAAQAGAKLVLAARSEARLAEIVQAIASEGGAAVYVVADVGREDDVRRIADAAIERFGRIDTWINDAGVAIYGRLEEVSDADNRRLFDTNFWGVVYGSLVALPHLRQNGGALINVGSEVSDAVIPLQGMYCASKHAVKGFTEALRMELEAADRPISVTLVKPSAIDTPYKEHAKNYLHSKPENPSPVYSPEVVAETILYCAENPVRDVFVGGAGKALSVAGKYAPRLTDKFMENAMIQAQTTSTPAFNDKEGLHGTSDSSLNERGDYDGYVSESSLFTKASLHPVIAGAIATGAALALGSGLAYSILRKNQSH